MSRSSIGIWLLALVALIAIGAAGWMHTKAHHLRNDLHKAEAARYQLGNDLKEAKGEAMQAEGAKEAAQQAKAGVDEDLRQAHSAIEAAEASLKQAREELTASKAAKEAAEAKLKTVTDELAQAQGAKADAETATAKAREDLQRERTSHTQEQVNPSAPNPPSPQAPQAPPQ